jgi:2,3-bisphosphoglycerate-independent phosphoglycerate mutase
MIGQDALVPLLIKNENKIVLLVLDGLGGLPREPGGKTELETAKTPNLDSLAEKSTLGLTDAIARGITPGSGPAHLGLFGYDPLQYQIGRGVLEALGIGLELTPRDVAARANFATRNENGVITDRRAGRISTERNLELCALLQGRIAQIDDVQILIRPGREHRFVVLFRGDNLSGDLSETDPQKEGRKPPPAAPLPPPDDPGHASAARTARIVNGFVARVNEILADQHPANTLLLRGLAKVPHIPSMETRYGVRSACIATYPMYRGLAKLVGMTLLPTGDSLVDQVRTLKDHSASYDFFFLHYKKTDSAGEDGNFEAKVAAIEHFDQHLPQVLALRPEVVVVTADHSTPCALRGHSWHPNPFLLCSPSCRPDGLREFSEKSCARGSLGRFPAKEAMPLLLAHALRLGKYGA